MNDRDTDRDWLSVASSNPYWGVLSAPEYMGADIDADAKTTFFASGEAYVSNLIATIHRQIAADIALHRALDFGCGVGRLALPLARNFGRVVGVDVVPRMLELTRMNAAAANVSNIDLVLGDDTLSQVEGTFDLVNTYIVLQHIPLARGYALLRRLVDLISVGGIGSLQLTYAKARRFIEHEAPRALYYRRDGGSIIDLVPAASAPPEGLITMFDYDLNQVFALLQRYVKGPIIATPSDDDGHLGVHLVFRKTAI